MEGMRTMPKETLVRVALNGQTAQMAVRHVPRVGDEFVVDDRVTVVTSVRWLNPAQWFAPVALLDLRLVAGPIEEEHEHEEPEA